MKLCVSYQVQCFEIRFFAKRQNVISKQMNPDAIKFISEIVKPWETLNQELSRPFSMNPEVNDYVTMAIGITVALKHFPESTKN